MPMQLIKYSLASLALAALVACGGTSVEPTTPDAAPGPTPTGADAPEAADHDHDHEEVSLGRCKIGDLEVELAQGHGAVSAGKEGHLVVKLPYNDGGATTVRAWIGTEDRARSLVGKGTYAPSHDDYDVHAEAPEPLPAGVQWWVEIERPDGTKHVGAADPIREP